MNWDKAGRGMKILIMDAMGQRVVAYHILVIKISNWVLPMHPEADHYCAPELWTPILSQFFTGEQNSPPKSPQFHHYRNAEFSQLSGGHGKTSISAIWINLTHKKPKKPSFQRPNKHTPAVSYPSHLIAYHHPLPMERLPHKQTSWMVQVQWGDRPCP